MEKWTSYYMEKMAGVNEGLLSPPKALVMTYGCQMNARDSEKLAGMLMKMGFAITNDEAQADLVIFNTCCVRENAENRLYGNLGNFKMRKEKNPNLKLVLCGCMMQQDMVVEKIKTSYPYVDVIFGTFNIYRFPQLLYTSMETKGLIVDIWEEAPEIVEDLPSLREYPFKAGVNIMYGCDNFCTFCIVPYVRGRERSRKPEDILAEVQALADDGVVEIMLLGQNVNSYDGGISFAELLQKVNEIEDIYRIRFISSHPKDITDDVIAAIRDLSKVCKYLHLPFQAGSDKILHDMNRRHTKKWYLDLVDRVKMEIPNISLTTDIMVGFPGETEEDFQDTLDIVRHARFASAFTFIYSRRLGTPADQMENQICENVIKDRFNRLLEEVNLISGEISAEKLGKTLEVLVEGISKDGLLYGRTDDNSLVHFAGNGDIAGQLVNVKIIEAKTFYLIGEIV